MWNQMRRIISGNRMVLFLHNLLLKRRFARIGTAKDVFTHHYAANYWGSAESCSGLGSTVDGTEKIRGEIAALMNRLGVKTILDAPCGDYNWFRLIPRGIDVMYTGGDIVDAMITENNRKFATPNTMFAQMDIVRDKLPDADLWICRDGMIHFSDKTILEVVDNLRRSNIRYFLTTTYKQSKRNIDIPTGAFRMLNLELPPFNFCKAVCYIDDWIEGHPIRQLALWERRSL